MRLREYYKKFKQLNPKHTKIKIMLLGCFLVFLCYQILKQLKNFDIMIIPILLVFLFSVISHEIAHGFVAHLFGDDTAKNAGRLSFNPLKHISIETFILPLILYLSGSKILIGSAKPVPVNFYKLKPYKLGFFCVSIAGIATNFFLAILCFLLLKFIPNQIYWLREILVFGYFGNIFLGLFNLIPITPLDGGRIVYILGNEKIKKIYNMIEPYGFMIVLGILLLLQQTNILYIIYSSIFNFFGNFIGVIV